MASEQSVNQRKQGVHGSILYGPNGVSVLYGKGDGTTGVTPVTTLVGARLKSNGTDLAWTEPEGHAIVAADTTHTTSNTTLSDITGLLVPIGASSTEAWLFKMWLMVAAANTTVDLKLGFTVPTSATMQWGVIGSPSTLAGFADPGTSGTPTALASESGTVAVGTANATVGVGIAGFIFGGGTAGNVQAQFAQNTSDASNLTVKKFSTIEYRRLQG